MSAKARTRRSRKGSSRRHTSPRRSRRLPSAADNRARSPGLADAGLSLRVHAFDRLPLGIHRPASTRSARRRSRRRVDVRLLCTRAIRRPLVSLAATFTRRASAVRGAASKQKSARTSWLAQRTTSSGRRRVGETPGLRGGSDSRGRGLCRRGRPERAHMHRHALACLTPRTEQIPPNSAVRLRRIAPPARRRIAFLEVVA